MGQDARTSPTVAGNGAPVLVHFNELFHIEPQIEWQMEIGEQLALSAFMPTLRPECVVEIGSKYGGSLQVLSRFAKRVFSLDIDPTCRERLASKYPNAEFITGPSQETLPPLLAKLQQEGTRLSLMLIDGDHTAKGVQGDVYALRDYRPACTLYVVMHDCFNPDVRHGIRTARWAENPYVHAVELDFLPGVLHYKDFCYRQMWGGFALAVLKPERRTGPLTITAKADGMQRALYGRSAHRPWDPQGLAHKIGLRMRRLFGMKP